MEEYKGVYQDLLSHIQQAVQIASSKHAKILSASQAAHDESVRSLKNENLELRRKVEFLNKQIDFLLADESATSKTIQVGKQRIDIDWSSSGTPRVAQWTVESVDEAGDTIDPPSHAEKQGLHAARTALRASGKRKGAPAFSLASASASTASAALSSSAEVIVQQSGGTTEGSSGYFDEQRAPAKQPCMPNRRRTFAPSVLSLASGNSAPTDSVKHGGRAATTDDQASLPMTQTVATESETVALATSNCSPFTQPTASALMGSLPGFGSVSGQTDTMTKVPDNVIPLIQSEPIKLPVPIQVLELKRDGGPVGPTASQSAGLPFARAINPVTVASAPVPVRSGPKPLDYSTVMKAMSGEITTVSSAVPVPAPAPARASVPPAAFVAHGNLPTLSKLAAVNQLSSAMIGAGFSSGSTSAPTGSAARIPAPRPGPQRAPGAPDPRVEAFRAAVMASSISLPPAVQRKKHASSASSTRPSIAAPPKSSGNATVTSDKSVPLSAPIISPAATLAETLGDEVKVPPQSAEPVPPNSPKAVPSQSQPIEDAGSASASSQPSTSTDLTALIVETKSPGSSTSAGSGKEGRKDWHGAGDKDLRTRVVKNIVEKSAEYAARKNDAEWLKNRLLYCQALERMLYKNADSRLQYLKAVAETR